jgi:hypothetical protein
LIEGITVFADPVSKTTSNSCGGFPIVIIPEYSVYFRYKFTSFLVNDSYSKFLIGDSSSFPSSLVLIKEKGDDLDLDKETTRILSEMDLINCFKVKEYCMKISNRINKTFFIIFLKYSDITKILIKFLL